MVNFIIILQVLGIFIIFVAIGLLIADDGTKEQKQMSYFLSGALVQNVGYLLELTAPTIDAAIVAVKIQYLGSIFVPLCYCWFIYGYCYEKIPYKLLKVLGTIDFCLLAVVFIFDKHSFYYRNLAWLESVEGHHYLSIEYGVCYPIFIICSCIVPYCLSIYALIRAIMTKSAYATNRKYKEIIFLSCFPTLALLAYATKITSVFDLTPVVLGTMLSMVVILIWRSRTYDFRGTAAEVVLNSMGDGVIIFDTQKKILSYNQAAVDIFTELSSHRLGDSVDDINDIPKDVLDEENNKNFSLHNRFYESHVKQILDKNGKNKGYVMLLLDVTDTRNYIEEIKQVREQAERANMAKSEFLANMSHEIRTPMNAVMGLSDIIMEESKGRRIYAYACDIKSASQNLLTIINDILDLSKVEAGKMELVTSDYYVKVIVDEVVHMMDIAASKRGILMKYEYDETIPCRYHGDEGRIKQILINILNNAIKFTQEGYVKVSIGGKPGETDDEELLIFKVEDTGSGIKKEDQEKIFENFKQVNSQKNRSVEGTGLGLSITKHLVELMHGKIELESVYGEGTTFTVTIPQKIVDRRALAEMGEIPVAEEEKVEAFAASSYKVLVVDDNQINRKVAKGFLKPYQFDLTEASSGFEAIELVRKNQYNMIFMDHMMPEMDGIEAVRIIRKECGENGRNAVIVALTANTMDGVKEQFLSSGFQDFVGKPLNKKQLNDVLLKWIPDELKDKPDFYNTDKDSQIEDSQIEDNDFAGIHIEGIDMNEAMKYQTGTLADYEELLQLYCMDGNRKLVLLNKLYQEKDYKNYEIEVHGLKSASANMGAMKVSAAARAHEEAAVRGDEEFIQKHFSELMSLYEEQLRHIQSFLDRKQDKVNDDEKELPDIDTAAIVSEVRAALEQLENFRSKECFNRIEDLLKYHLKDDTAAKLAEISEQLKLYEDDKAEQLLRQLLEWLDKEE